MKKIYNTYPNFMENKKQTLEGLANMQKCCNVEKEITENMLEGKDFITVYSDILSNTSLPERLDLLLASLNLQPKGLTPLCKLILVSRLVVFNRDNYVAFQLSQPGTGKSFLFEGWIKGAYNHTGATTAPILFGSNGSNKTTGILADYHTVNIDEVILKGTTSNFEGCDEKFRGFLGNGSVSRDAEERFSNTSVMFTGNLYGEQEILYKYPYNFKNKIKGKDETEILANLTPVLNNDAVKDRVNMLLPLWAIKKPPLARHQDSFGLNSNFLENVLLEQRKINYIKSSKELSPYESSGRDYEKILKTFNGLLVLLFPNKDYTDIDYQALLSLAIFFKKIINNELFALHKSPEYCCFMLKILEPNLPFKFDDISEIFPSFDRITLKLNNDRNFVYTVPLTMFGEKMSREEYSASKDPNYSNIIIKMEVIDSDLFILKHHCASLYHKKGIFISDFFEKKGELEDIEDNNIKYILNKLLKKLEDLENDIASIKQVEKSNFKFVNRTQRNTLIEIDEIKEAYNSLIEVVNEDRWNKDKVEPVVFKESEFPLDKQVTSKQCSSFFLGKIATSLNCSISKIEEQLLSYNEEDNSLKLVSFYNLLHRQD